MFNFETEKLEFSNEINAEVYFLCYSDFETDEIAPHVLNADELHRYKNFKSLKRKREFVATRKLKNEIIGDEAIFYNGDGRPMTKNFPNLSFSHARNVCGIALAERPIGLDLEPINTKILRVRDKFLAASERKVFDIDDTTSLVRIWSAKEALYKLAPKNGLIFSTDLIISLLFHDKQKKEEVYLIGELRLPGKTITYKLLSKKISNFIVTINTNLGNEKS